MQSEQTAASFRERLQSDSEIMFGETLERVQQTACLLENTTVAAMEARVRRGAEELMESTGAHLQQLAQENLDFVSEQLAERQKQFTGEMSQALHCTFDELVEASSARLRKLADDSLDLIAGQLAARQKLLISDTTKAFRQKIGEILVTLQNGAAENT